MSGERDWGLTAYFLKKHDNKLAFPLTEQVKVEALYALGFSTAACDKATKPNYEGALTYQVGIPTPTPSASPTSAPTVSVADSFFKGPCVLLELPREANKIEASVAVQECNVAGLQSTLAITYCWLRAEAHLAAPRAMPTM